MAMRRHSATELLLCVARLSRTVTYKNMGYVSSEDLEGAADVNNFQKRARRWRRPTSVILKHSLRFSAHLGARGRFSCERDVTARHGQRNGREARSIEFPMPLHPFSCLFGAPPHGCSNSAEQHRLKEHSAWDAIRQPENKHKYKNSPPLHLTLQLTYKHDSSECHASVPSHIK